MSDGTAHELIADFLDAELVAEAQRRTTIEARALAAITANLGLATLYFAVRTQLRLQAFSRGDAASILLLVALALSACSVFASIWVIRPRRNIATEVDAIRELVDYVKLKPDVPATRVQERLIEARLRELSDADKANTKRAFALATSVVLLALAAVALVLSLVSSSYAPAAMQGSGTVPMQVCSASSFQDVFAARDVATGEPHFTLPLCAHRPESK